MSPRRQDKNDFHDSTTDLFLKIVQKEKEQSTKDENKEQNMMGTISSKKTKTINKFGCFYNYINQTLDKILSSKASIMILSLLMAGILFFSISGDDILSSPTSGITLDNVPVKIEGLNDQLELTGVPEHVQVVLIGPSFDIFKMNLVKNYEIYADVTGMISGEHEIRLKHRNFPNSLTVVIVPDNLKIKLAEKESAEFNLGAHFINEQELDTKYSVSVEKMALQKVTVRASRETLNKIERVDACIDVSEKTEAFEQEANIKAYDKYGNEVKADISPSKVHVHCDVSSYSKTVPIKIQFSGNVALGYQIERYTLSQNQITIYGEQSQLKDINQVVVPIDISDLSKSTNFDKIPIKRVSGINKLSMNTIDVQVDVAKVITKKFDKVLIKVLNKSSDYKVSFAGESQYATVAVTGSEEKIAALTLDNIQVSVDIDKLKVGSKKVNVSVVIDDETLEVKLLSSSKVTINIERN